jgi:hypothetical protein
MDRILTQAEADVLLTMEKRCPLTESFSFPGAGGKLVVPVESLDGREKFLLDINRGRIKLMQCTYQERFRGAIILVRVDLDGPEHTNPDGVVIPCPHIHVYREGFGDKWANPLPASFANPADLWLTLSDFYSFCNVTQPPILQRSLV